MVPAERYGYSVARLRAMENRLLDDSVLQRLVESEDLDSATKILGETPYAEWLVELKSNLEFDKAIELELGYVYSEITKFVPDTRLVEICRLPYDFHNVKVLLKSHILQREGGERRFDLLTDLGTIPTDDLILSVESEDYRLLPFGLHSALPKCMNMWEQTHDILEIEKLLDNLLFSEMCRLSSDMGIDAVEKWLKGRIDAENIRNLIRLKRMDVEVSTVATFLHNGGWVSVERLLSLLGEPLEGWGRVLAFADIGGVLQQTQDISDLGSLIVEMEKVLDEYTTRLLEKARYGAFSPENVIYYLWLKEMETKNLRMLLVSIANDTDREIVRRLIRRG